MLRKNVDSILAASRKLDQSAAERQARAERAKAQREQQLAQAEAVARAGPNATNLFKEVFGGDRPLDDKDQEIVINPIAGTVTVLATERQHDLVQQYLDSVQMLGAAPGADRGDHRRGAAVPEPIRRGSTGSSSRTTETGSGSSSR